MGKELITMSDWKKKLKIAFKKFVRWILRKYKKEIKRYVNEWIDIKLIEMQKVVSEEVRKRVRNEVVAKAIEENIDIYSSAGANTVKQIISESLDKLES